MLEIRSLRKTYPGFVLDMNLEVPDDGITGIVGPNGSGKTTLIKSILGLIRTDEIDGRLFDSRIDRLSLQEKERIGVVFSESGFCEILTLKQIRSILKNEYRNFDEDSFSSLVDSFSLPMESRLEELSTGQKNLVKLVAALSHRASFLILDEPTNGLDVSMRQKVLQILAGYVEKYQASILITSHISADLERFCDDLVLIRNGRNVLHDRMDAILEDYGIIKTESIPEDLDMEYILAREKTPYGYRLLTDQKQFYRENYPDLVVENTTLDDVELILFQEEMK